MIGVLLIMQGKLGHQLLDTLADLLGELPLAADALDVQRAQPAERLLAQGRQLLERLDSGDGVLILTDAFGSTPSNIASRLAAPGSRVVVAGVNLPMLIRVFNYPHLTLPEMVDNAIEGGRRGILACPSDDSGA